MRFRITVTINAKTKEEAAERLFGARIYNYVKIEEMTDEEITQEDAAIKKILD